MKIGLFNRIPEVDVATCIDKLKEAKVKLGKQNSVGREAFIDSMGFKVSNKIGGRVSNVLSSMGSYGLIDSGGKEIRITNLALDLIYNEDPVELKKLRSKTVLNVEIFNRLYLTYGTRPTEDSIRVFLREKAGINNPEELANTIKVLSKMVRDNFQYIDEEVEPIKKENLQNKEEPVEVLTAKNVIQTTSGNIGDGIIKIELPGKPPYVVPLDDIDLTISLVSAILNKEKERRKHTEPIQTTIDQ